MAMLMEQTGEFERINNRLYFIGINNYREFIKKKPLVSIEELEKKLRGLLGRKVKIVEGARSKRLELEYSDNDDLQKLLYLLCGNEIMKD